jgi:HlyD family secretion protein
MESIKSGGSAMSKDHASPILSNYKPKPPGAVRDRKRVLSIVLMGAVAVAALWFGLASRDGAALTGWTEAAVSIGPMDDAVQASGSIEMKRTRTVLSPEAGTLARRVAEQGAWVNSGALLAQLAAPDLDEALDKAMSDLAAAERDLSVLDSNRGFALEREAIDSGKKRRAVNDAEAALIRARELEAAGSGTAKDSADKERALTEAREALSLADLSIRESEQSYRFSRSALLDKLETLRGSKASLMQRIADLNVRSPISGRLLSWKAAEGDVLSRYGVLANLADTGEPEAVFAVAEATAARLGVGMKISISVGGASYPGSVSAIGRETTASADLGSTVQVSASFDGDTPEFASGATASGEILIATKAEALLLPRGPFLSSGNAKYAYVIEGNYAVRRAVSYGSSKGGMIEVLSGLEAGERVLTSDYRDFIDQETIKLGGGK